MTRRPRVGEKGLSANRGDGRREVLIEMQSFGNSVKVSAIDPVTGTEVSIVGDPRYGEEVLKRTALRKLNYVLTKKSGTDNKGGTIV